MRNKLLPILVFCLTLLSLTPTAQAKNKHWALRGLGEFGMGTLIGTAAGGTAMVTGILLQDNHEPTWPTYLISGVLYPTGIAGGALLGGYLTDSKAKAWTPFVGAYAGAIVGDTIAYFLKDDAPVVSALLVLILPIVGAITAMEISHHKAGSHTPSSETAIAPESAATAYLPLQLQFSF